MCYADEYDNLTNILIREAMQVEAMASNAKGLGKINSNAFYNKGITDLYYEGTEVLDEG